MGVLGGTWDVASVTKAWNFKFYFIIINFNAGNHVEPVAMVLDGTSLERRP